MVLITQNLIKLIKRHLTKMVAIKNYYKISKRPYTFSFGAGPHIRTIDAIAAILWFYFICREHLRVCHGCQGSENVGARRPPKGGAEYKMQATEEEMKSQPAKQLPIKIALKTLNQAACIKLISCSSNADCSFTTCIILTRADSGSPQKKYATLFRVAQKYCLSIFEYRTSQSTPSPRPKNVAKTTQKPLRSER